jgi:hypothetical protein
MSAVVAIIAFENFLQKNAFLMIKPIGYERLLVRMVFFDD